MRLIEEGSVYVGLASFISREIKRNCVDVLLLLKEESTNRLEDRVVSLSSYLYEVESKPSAILVRKCYAEFANRAFTYLLERKGDVLIAGTQGIGKSVFGHLFLLLLLEKGKIVCYQHMQQKMLIIGKNADVEGMNTVLQLQTIFGYNPVSTHGAFVLNYETELWEALLKQRDIFFVQDLGDDMRATLTVDGFAPKLIISAPDNDQLNTLHHNSRLLRLYMPRWSLDELRVAHEHCFSSREFEQFDDAELVRRFKEYDGIPRYVLEFDLEAAEELVLQQIRRLSITELREMFTTTSYFNLKSQSYTSALIHVIPDPTDPNRFTSVFASSSIEQRIAEKLVLGGSYNIHRFVYTSWDVPKLAKLREYALESYAHEYLIGGRRTIKLAPLLPTNENKKNPALTFREVNLSPLTRSTFSNDDMCDLIKLALNEYVIPPRWNKTKAFDSFVVLNHSFATEVTKKNKFEYYLVVFFFTDTRDGEVGSDLKTLREKVASLMNVEESKLTTELVFGSETKVNKLLQIRENCEADANDDTEGISQFVFHMEGLNALNGTV